MVEDRARYEQELRNVVVKLDQMAREAEDSKLPLTHGADIYAWSNLFRRLGADYLADLVDPALNEHWRTYVEIIQTEINVLLNHCGLVQEDDGLFLIKEY